MSNIDILNEFYISKLNGRFTGELNKTKDKLSLIGEINLFDSFLKLSYTSYENKWSIQLKSIQNYLRYYLSYFESCYTGKNRTGNTFKEWCTDTSGDELRQCCAICFS